MSKPEGYDMAKVSDAGSEILLLYCVMGASLAILCLTILLL